MNSDLLKKIQKLYALAQDPSNEHEAALAAEKVRQLLEQHNLAMVDVLEESKESDERRLRFGEKMPAFHIILWEACSSLFDIEALRLHRRKGARVVIVVCGIPQNIEAAIETFLYFTASIRSLETRHSFDRPSQRNSYRLGAAQRLTDEARHLKSKADNPDSTALIHIGKAIATKHIAENYRRGRKRSFVASGTDAYAEALGYEDGELINLHGAGKHLAGREAQ